MKSNNKIIVIAGPTASGKSEVANSLALNINGEVISADSMQIYKGMDIGTGKFLPEEQSVKHWGIDICNPDQAYSVALYQKYARDAVEDIFSRGKIPILCGGTGFYIRSVIDDYKFLEGEQTDNPIREKYQKYFDENGSHALWELLKQKDSISAGVIHENNVIRVIRALEMHENGQSYANQVEKLQNINQKYPAVFFGLKVDPQILRNRIDDRVDKMFKNGLINEVKQLLKKGYKDAITAANAIGYKETVKYLDGKCTLDQAKDQIKISSRQYAKRQRTWFNKDKRINWITYDQANIDYAIDFILKNI